MFRESATMSYLAGGAKWISESQVLRSPIPKTLASSFPTDQQVLGGLDWWLGFSFEPLVLVEVEGVWKLLPGTPPTEVEGPETESLQTRPNGASPKRGKRSAPRCSDSPFLSIWNSNQHHSLVCALPSCVSGPRACFLFFFVLQHVPTCVLQKRGFSRTRGGFLGAKQLGELGQGLRESDQTRVEWG